MQQNECLGDCPKEVTKILNPDEVVLSILRQSRLKASIAPDTVVVTDQRIILCAPSAFGLKKEIEDYRYQDMANFKINKGLITGGITISQNFMSEDLVITDLPKGPLDDIAKIIQEKIRQARDQQVTRQATPLSQTQDPLMALKMRFVQGEITKEQFEEMKQLLE